MQVDDQIGAGEYLLVHGIGDLLSDGAVRFARMHAIHVLAIIGTDPFARREAVDIRTWQNPQLAFHRHRIKFVAQIQRAQDTVAFIAMLARQRDQLRSRLRSLEHDQGQARGPQPGMPNLQPIAPFLARIELDLRRILNDQRR